MMCLQHSGRPFLWNSTYFPCLFSGVCTPSYEEAAPLALRKNNFMTFYNTANKL